MYFHGLLVLLFLATYAESLQFVVSKLLSAELNKHHGDVLNISCQTDDPDAIVNLIFKRFDNQNIEKRNQTFTIYDVNVHNNGMLTCHASNKHANISLELGKLRVSQIRCKEDVKIVGNLLIQNVEKNQNVSLICSGIAPKDAHLLTWKKDGTTLTSSYNYFQVNDVDHEQAMLNVLNSQASVAGKYTCVRYVSSCGTDTSTSQEIQLRFINPFTPKFSQPVQQHEVLAGSSITISCVVTASPAPDMEWRRMGNLVKRCPNNRTCNLLLKDVIDGEDGGNYICTATNSEGPAQSNHTVIVLVPPKVKEKYDPKHQRSFACEVTQGFPSPVVYWQKKVPCVSQKSCLPVWKNLTGTSFKVETISSTVSKITFADNKEEGTFRCVAINKAGNGTTQIILKKSSKGGLSNGSIVGIVCAFLFILVLCIIIMLCYKKYLKMTYALYMGPDPNFTLDPDRTLFEQSIELPYDPEWEFPRERLKKIRNLGAGAFGQVYLAHAIGILALKPRDKDTATIHRRTRLRLSKKVPKKLFQCFFDDNSFEQSIFVAVKTLKDNPNDTEYKDLASEIKVLIHLGNHENIVNVLGACTRGGNICAIMEYCPYGNLVTFLKERRNTFSLAWEKQTDSYDDDFCFFDATTVALQIARGMSFLSEKKVVHRDLAARNILVGADHVIKIADFGLARDIYATDFYFKESSGMLPVKWMAPESLFDKLYTVKSDVWSFGIVLWEICTMGGSPYPGLPMENLFEYLQAGNRMEQPGTCPDELYEIMTQCWQENMEERPFFHELESQLERILEHNTRMTNNLAAFERLMSCSSETDYLVPQSPAKKKKGSLDALLNLRSKAATFQASRKKSADILINFPPANEGDENILTENNDKLKDELSPISENTYVDLANSTKPSEDSNHNVQPVKTEEV